MNTQQPNLYLFQANRLLSSTEENQINQQLHTFLANWQTHQQAIKATANIKEKIFIVVAVDINSVVPSGCAIDELNNFIKKLNETYQINFFDRLSIVYLDEQQNKHIKPLAQIKSQLLNKQLSPDTLFFDTNIQNTSQLENQFLKPFKQSWLSKYCK